MALLHVNMKKYFISFIFLILDIPRISFGQTGVGTPPQGSFMYFTDLNSFKTFIFGFFDIIIPILSGVSLILFFWGVAQFILHADDTKAHVAGKQFMIWGVIAIFCLFSFWGIIGFLSDQFGFAHATGWSYLPQ